MARIKGAINAKKKHKRVLKLAKGYRGARSKQYRIAKQSVMRAMASAFAGRKQRKRDMRAGVDINRKMLAELAVNDAAGFASLAEIAKANA